MKRFVVSIFASLHKVKSLIAYIFDKGQINCMKPNVIRSKLNELGFYDSQTKDAIL